MEFTTSLKFYDLIAFVLPGFASLFSIRYFSNYINQLIIQITSSEPKINHVIILLIVSLICGLIISAIRNLILDKIQFWTGVKEQTTDYSKLKSEGTQKLFDAAVNNIYRFCQFYGNIFITIFAHLLIYIFNHWKHNDLKSYTVTGIIIIIEVILFINHRSLLKEIQVVKKEIV
jgi:hypothetical protein